MLAYVLGEVRQSLCRGHAIVLIGDPSHPYVIDPWVATRVVASKERARHDRDVFTVKQFAAKLLVIDRRGPVGVIANRIQPNTHTHDKLMHFLGCLDVPCVAQFRDSPVYTDAAELGQGVVDMKDCRHGPMRQAVKVSNNTFANGVTMGGIQVVHQAVSALAWRDEAHVRENIALYRRKFAQVTKILQTH